jgi:DNA recombination protein RmuC
MDLQLPFASLATLTLGLVLGVVLNWLLASARGRADRAQADAQLAQARADAERWRADSEQARADAERSRATLADMRATTAEAQSEVAAVAAEVAAAVAEREAAVARAAELAADRESMRNQFKVLSTETIENQGKLAEANAEARLRATEQLMAPVRESLDRFNLRLTDVEKERVAMATDLRAQVRAVQETGESLRRETTALVTALRKPQIRGSWGETQLKRVAEISGMVERCDFDLQHTSKADGATVRPDMRVNLAEGKHIFVDSKVPLSAFLDAAETDDERLRGVHLANYAKNVRTHVDQLSSKQYWKAAESPEFVVLFLPNEAFFTAALDQVPDLYEYAASRDVVLATPTTLIGMLRAVAYGWKQAALAESAAEVFRLGRDLHDKLGLMGNRLDKLGRALRTSVNAYNETIATVEGTVLVRARKFRDLKVSEKELGCLTPVDEPVRQIQATELVEDAAKVAPLVGRGRRRTHPLSEVPEADELVRLEPDLLELIAEVSPADLGAETTGS